jgi:hypothetical protein
MNRALSFLLFSLSFVCFVFPCLWIFHGIIENNESEMILGFFSVLGFFPTASWLMNKALEAEKDGLALPRFSNKKVGGIRFIRLGRFVFSYSVSKGAKKRLGKLPTPSPIHLDIDSIGVQPRAFT